MKQVIKFVVVALISAMFGAGIAYATLIDDQKAQYLADMRSLADLLALTRDRAKELDQKWASLGFGSGGAHEFIQADIDATAYSGLTTTELTSCVTTAQAFETWYTAGHDDNMEQIRQ